MKYYYDDSIKEVSEVKKSRVSVSKSQNKLVESQSANKMMDSQGQQGMTKFTKKNQIISLEEVEKLKQIEKIIDKSLNFKESVSSNSLRPPSLDNTLKPPPNITNKPSSFEGREGAEGFRSVL